MAKQRRLADLLTTLRVDKKQLEQLPAAAKKATADLNQKLGGSGKAAKELEKRIDSVGGALTHLGPAGVAAGSALQGLSSSASSLLGTLGVLGSIGVGALFGLAGAAVYAERKYEGLVNRIDDLQDVTNTSAEQASRLIHIFDVLGLSEDQGADLMFKFARAVADNSDKLAALGVHIQNTATGTVDLYETLFAVADAYTATDDANVKTQILFAAFGRTGKDLIDVLEQGSSTLRQFAADTKLVLSEEDIQRMRDYHIHQKQVTKGWDDFWASVGQKVFPVLDSLQERIRKESTVEDELQKMVKQGAISERDYAHSMRGSGDAVDKLRDKLGKEFDEKEKLNFQTAKLTDTLEQEAQKHHRVAQSINDEISAMRDKYNAQISLDRANIALTTSDDKVTAAEKAYHDAVKQHGQDSAEARQAFADYSNSLLDQEQAYLTAAEAAANLAKATHRTSDEQEAAEVQVQATIDKFQAEANTLAPGSALRKQLEGYIADLKKIPITVTTDVQVNLPKSVSGKVLVGAFQGGGHPPPGRDIVVGERGPEIVRINEPSTVYPNGTAPPLTSGDVHIEINVTSEADAADIAHAVGWEIRKLRRAG